MTWDERAKAGVDAEHFQAALAAKQSASVPYYAGGGGGECCDFCTARPVSKTYPCHNFMWNKQAVFAHESVEDLAIISFMMPSAPDSPRMPVRLESAPTSRAADH